MFSRRGAFLVALRRFWKPPLLVLRPRRVTAYSRPFAVPIG
jgi:hypothetical protein